MSTPTHGPSKPKVRTPLAVQHANTSSVPTPSFGRNEPPNAKLKLKTPHSASPVRIHNQYDRPLLNTAEATTPKKNLASRLASVSGNNMNGTDNSSRTKLGERPLKQLEEALIQSLTRHQNSTTKTKKSKKIHPLCGFLQSDARWHIAATPGRCFSHKDNKLISLMCLALCGTSGSSPASMLSKNMWGKQSKAILNVTRKFIRDIVNEDDKLETQLRAATETTNDLQLENHSLRREMMALREMMEMKEREMESHATTLRETLEIKEREVESHATRNDELNKALATVKEQLVDLKQQLSDTTNACTKLESDKVKLLRFISVAKAKFGERNQQLLSMAEAHRQLQSKSKLLADQLEETSQELSSLQAATPRDIDVLELVNARVKEANNSGLFFLTSNSRKRFGFLKIAKPRRTAQGNRERSVKSAVCQIAAALKEVALDEAEQTKIVSGLAARRGLTFIDAAELPIKINDVIALRQATTTTTNEVVKMLSGLKHVHPIFRTALPNQLKAKIGETERNKQNFDLDYEMVDLVYKKTTNEKQQCLHFWMRNPAEAIEVLVASAVQSDKFENSCEFSSLLDKCLVVFGCDKGGKAASMLVRTANRTRGNNPAHALPIAVYMDGSECYDNLSRTILSEGRPAKSLLQQLLDDDLHIAVMSLVVAGDVMDVRSVLFHIKNMPSFCSKVNIENGTNVVTEDENLFFDSTVSEASQRCGPPSFLPVLLLKHQFALKPSWLYATMLTLVWSLEQAVMEYRKKHPSIPHSSSFVFVTRPRSSVLIPSVKPVSCV